MLWKKAYTRKRREIPCFARICPVTPQEMPLEQAMQPDIAMENIKEKAKILK
jgi:hypothetical protein